MPIDAYALAILPLPHQLRRWIAVRFARERDVLVLADRHRALGRQRVQNVRWHLRTDRKERGRNPV